MFKRTSEASIKEHLTRLVRMRRFIFFLQQTKSLRRVEGIWELTISCLSQSDPLSIEPDKWETPLFFLPGRLPPPPDPPLGRTGGGRTPCIFCFFTSGGPLFAHCFFSAFLKVYKPRELSHLFSRQISHRMH